MVLQQERAILPLACPKGLLGKENPMRVLMILAILAFMGSALVGCRAEGEIGDTATSIAQPR
jgi:hypothetical protein